MPGLVNIAWNNLMYSVYTHCTEYIYFRCNCLLGCLAKCDFKVPSSLTLIRLELNECLVLFHQGFLGSSVVYGCHLAVQSETARKPAFVLQNDGKHCILTNTWSITLHVDFNDHIVIVRQWVYRLFEAIATDCFYSSSCPVRT